MQSVFYTGYKPPTVGKFDVAHSCPGLISGRRHHPGTDFLLCTVSPTEQVRGVA